MSEALDHDRILAVALGAARGAGEILLSKLGALDPSKIGSKSAARDLVTEADVASERHLVERLRSAFPDHTIESEEEVCDADDGAPRWFLDPLDGTVNFVHRLPLFAVSMGLFVNGRPEVAVVHAPRLGETFHAVRGQGAWLDEAGHPPQRMGVRPTTELGDAVLATGFPYRRHELPNNNLGNFSALFNHVRGMRRMGAAALDLAYVAAGRLDGFWELHLSPHDVAAGALLVSEAGGEVTDFSGEQNWLRGGDIIAAGAELHGQIADAVRK